MLSPAQRRLWDEPSEIPDHFVLYGGTALALRMGHRKSEDFDFFTNRHFDPVGLEREIAWLDQAVRLQSAPNTLVAIVDRDGPVKLLFFGGLTIRRVGTPERTKGPGILISSLLDIAATKVKSVQDRAEAKDYLDLASIITGGVGSAESLGAARAVYGERFSPVLSLKALCYFEDGDLPTLPDAVRSTLRDAAGRVELAALPTVEPLADGLSPGDAP